MNVSTASEHSYPPFVWVIMHTLSAANAPVSLYLREGMERKCLDFQQLSLLLPLLLHLKAPTVQCKFGLDS